MIKLTDNLWIGTSTDELRADLESVGIGAILNVAQDMQATRGWRSGVEYMQVGLIDGPGNPLPAYPAAVLALAALLARAKVMVCCHDGSRSLAVVIMYLGALTRSMRSWDGWLETLKEWTDASLPKVNEAHRAAYDRMRWQSLSKLAGGVK